VIAGGLTAIAARQIWNNYRSNEREIEADASAIKVAERRGYETTLAAKLLLSAIEHLAQIEQRSSLSFTELIRCQNLRTLALNTQT